MEEIYKDIKNLEGKYQVSNFGNILSLNYGRTRKPKLLKPSKNKFGYLKVRLCKNGNRKISLSIVLLQRHLSQIQTIFQKLIIRMKIKKTTTSRI